MALDRSATSIISNAGTDMNHFQANKKLVSGVESGPATRETQVKTSLTVSHTWKQVPA